MNASTPRKLTGAQKVSVILLPWLFLGLFAYLYATFLLPQARGGHLLAACFGVFVALFFASFTVAAGTFSRDVLAGRYPEASPAANALPGEGRSRRGQRSPWRGFLRPA